jgi:hypothetical protein
MLFPASAVLLGGCGLLGLVLWGLLLYWSYATYREVDRLGYALTESVQILLVVQAETLRMHRQQGDLQREVLGLRLDMTANFGRQDGVLGGIVRALRQEALVRGEE